MSPKLTKFAPKYIYLNMNKNILKTLTLVLVAVQLASCSNYRNVAYFQNSRSLPTVPPSVELYNAHIMPKDLITITVNTTDPEASVPFNLTVQSRETSHFGSVPTTSQASLQQYLVNNDGDIQFPVLGTLHVGGLTLNETEEMLRSHLVPYLKETPIVTVRLQSFKVSVLGEVTQPGQFTVINEKINLLEALALAGDMTIWGQRDNVKLIREDAEGNRKIHELNLNDANIIYSPYYQLEQNDIIYVTPNITKSRNSDIGNSTTLWFSATSILISLASLVYNILK